MFILKTKSREEAAAIAAKCRLHSSVNEGSIT